jgi:hypothetical protein
MSVSLTMRGGVFCVCVRVRDIASAALTDARPRHRYRVGLDARYFFPVLSKLPTVWSDALYLLPQRTWPLPAAVAARRHHQ